MRLVSLNTWKAEGDYPRRLRAMAQGLAALSADVIALQEDLRTDDGLTHTARTLADALDLHLSWLPARAKLRDVEQRRTPTTSGLAVLSREPLPEQRVIALPEDARDGQRLAQAVRLPAALGGGWLINLHLSHLPDRPDLRRAQLATVLREAGDRAADARWLLCGDFNARPDDPAIAWALQPGGPLTDAFAGVPKTTHTDDQGRAADIDHILFRPVTGQGVAVRRAWVTLDQPDGSGMRPSDHGAVCADLF